MNFSIENFLETVLGPDEYFLLYAIIYDDKELIDYLHKQMGEGLFMRSLGTLQAYEYLKLNQDYSWTLRQKALTLQSQIKPEVAFDKFWDKYHEVTGLKKTDLQAALKYWKKLTKQEKQLAFDNIKPYFYSLPVYSTGRPVKKARTYLGDKNFNDEFDYKEDKPSINRMV